MEKIPQPTYKTTIEIQGRIIAVRKVQDRGRVQIPKEIRKKLQIKDGDSIYWTEDTEGKYYILKATRASKLIF